MYFELKVICELFMFYPCAVMCDYPAYQSRLCDGDEFRLCDGIVMWPWVWNCIVIAHKLQYVVSWEHFEKLCAMSFY